LGLGSALGCVLALSLDLLPHDLLAQGLGLQPCDLPALRLDFAACGQFGLFCGLSQRCQLSLSLGGAPHCVLAANLSLALSCLFAQDLGLQACGQLRPGIGFKAHSQLERLDGLSQDCQFSLGLGGDPRCVLALSFSLTPGSLLALGLSLKSSGQLVLHFGGVAFTLFAQSDGFLQCRQLSSSLSSASRRLRAIGLRFATSGLPAQGLGLQPCDHLALRLNFAACSQFGLFYGLTQRGQLSLRLGGAPDCRLTMGFNLPLCGIFVWGIGLLARSGLAQPSVGFVACSQLALLDCLTQHNQLTIGLRGALDCLLAISLSFATSGLLALGLGLQACDLLALRLDFVACGQFGQLQGLSQLCKLALTLVAGPGRLFAMGSSLLA
jgi:hypothetical protein